MARNASLFERVSKDVKAVLVASKGSLTRGTTVMELDREYREQIGRHIPVQDLGFSSLLDFLQCLQSSNVIKIVDRGATKMVLPCVTEDLQHVSKLVKGQRMRRRGSGRRGGGNGQSCSEQSSQLVKLDSRMLDKVVKLVGNETKGIDTSVIMAYLRDRIDYRINEQQLIRQLSELTDVVVVRGNVVYPVSKKQTSSRSMSHGINGNSRYVYRKQNDSAASRRVESAILSATHDDDHGRNVPTGAAAAPAAQSFPENNYNHTRKRTTEKKVKTHDREDDNLNGVDHDDDAPTIVDRRTKFRLEKLIQQHPRGLWCAQLPSLYHKEYGISLNYTELGFGSVIEFSACLPDIFRWTRPQPLGDFKLFHVKIPETDESNNDRPAQTRLTLAALHDIYQRYGDETDEPLPTTISTETTKRLIPGDVLTIGETVAQISVTELFSNGQNSLEVNVVEVVTPTLFWIQERKRETKFEEFMTELHEFYTLNASKYIMPIIVLEKGLNCACMFDGTWHRGIIKAVKHDSTTTIMMYDFGTLKNYPPNEIYFLHKKFSGLPSQAIACGLANVRPKFGNRWSSKICEKFSEIAFDVPMVATGVSIDVNNNSMFIGLTNTEKSEDVHINDWMVARGYAVYGKMGDSVDTNETHDDSPIIENDLKKKIMSVENMLSELLRLTAANVGKSSVASINPVIEKSESIIDSTFTDLSSHNDVAANTTSEALNGLIQQATIFLATQSTIETNGLRSDVDRASDVGVDSSPFQTDLASDDEVNSNNLDDLFKKMSIHEQQPEKSRISGIPSTTNPENRLTQSNRSQNFDPRDVNSNFTTNPFKRPTFFAPNVDGKSFIDNESVKSVGKSAIDNENVKSLNRSLFENSVEKATARFFDRLNLNPTSTLPDTNPFKIDIENNDKRWTNDGQSTTMASSIAQKTTNPFLMENHGIFYHTDTSTRIVYEAEPVVYDLTSNDENSIASVCDEWKALEASKNDDIAFWIENGACNNANSSLRRVVNGTQSIGQNITTDRYEFVDHGDNYDFTNSPNTFVTPDMIVDTEKSRLPPPLPPRPKSMINSTVVEFPISDVKTDSRTGLNEWNCIETDKATKFETEIDRTNSHIANQQPDEWNSIDTEKATNFETKIDRTNPHVATQQPEESAIIKTNRANEEKANSSEHKKLDRAAEKVLTVNKFNCKEIHLTKQKVIRIQLDDEGWLTLEDFIGAFTTYKIPEVVVKILEIMNAPIPFRVLNRSDCPLLFVRLDRTSVAAERDCNNRIRGPLQLVPIKSMSRILGVLKTVERETSARNSLRHEKY